MGLFSKEKVVSVATSTNKLVEKLPNRVRQAVAEAVGGSSNIAMSLINENLFGYSQNADAAYRYAKYTFYRGLPEGHNSAVNKFHDEILKQIELVEGTTCAIHQIMYAKPYAEDMAQIAHNMDTTGTVPKMKERAYIKGDNITIHYTNSNPYVHTSKMPAGITEREPAYMVSYVVGTGTVLKGWGYNPSTNAIPSLPKIPRHKHISKYYPIVPIRLGAGDGLNPYFIDATTPKVVNPGGSTIDFDKYPGLIGLLPYLPGGGTAVLKQVDKYPLALKQSAKILEYYGVNLEDLLENIKGDPEAGTKNTALDDVDNMFILFGADILSNDPDVKDYLYEQLSVYAEDSNVDFADYLENLLRLKPAVGTSFPEAQAFIDAYRLSLIKPTLVNQEDATKKEDALVVSMVVELQSKKLATWSKANKNRIIINEAEYRSGFKKTDGSAFGSNFNLRIEFDAYTKGRVKRNIGAAGTIITEHEYPHIANSHRTNDIKYIRQTGDKNVCEYIKLYNLSSYTEVYEGEFVRKDIKSASKDPITDFNDIHNGYAERYRSLVRTHGTMGVGPWATAGGTGSSNPYGYFLYGIPIGPISYVNKQLINLKAYNLATVAPPHVLASIAHLDKLVDDAVLEAKKNGGDFQDKSFFLPLNRDVTNKFVGTKRSNIFYRSLSLHSYALKIDYLKWYEQKWFGSVIKIVGIVLLIISIWTAGATAKPGTALLAMAKAIAIAYAVRMVLTIIMEAVGLEGVLLVIAAVTIAIIAGGETSAFMNALPDAVELVDVVLFMAQQVPALIDLDTQGIIEEIKQNQDEHKAWMEEHAETLEDDYDSTYATTYSEELLKSNGELINETPTEFYNRTIHNKNPGVVSNGLIATSTSISLTLPKLPEDLI